MDTGRREEAGPEDRSLLDANDMADVPSELYG